MGWNYMIRHQTKINNIGWNIKKTLPGFQGGFCSVQTFLGAFNYRQVFMPANKHSLGIITFCPP